MDLLFPVLKQKILTKKQLLELLISLVEANDIELINNDDLLDSSVCLPTERSKVRQIASLVSLLYDSYDYGNSEEFERSLEGKSPALRAMKRKMISDPMKRSESKNRFAKALTNVMASAEAYELLPLSHHATLQNIKDLLSGLSNPDQVEQSYLQ